MPPVVDTLIVRGREGREEGKATQQGPEIEERVQKGAGGSKGRPRGPQGHRFQAVPTVRFESLRCVSLLTGARGVRRTGADGDFEAGQLFERSEAALLRVAPSNRLRFPISYAEQTSGVLGREQFSRFLRDMRVGASAPVSACVASRLRPPHASR